MRTKELALAAAAAGVWTAGYLCVKTIFSNRSAEWCSRIVAASHAVVVTGLAANALRLGPNPWIEAGADNDFAQDLAIIVSLGYFIYDLAWVAYYTPEDVVMITHHSIANITFGHVLVTGRSGIETCASLVAMELTNPLLQARWFIRDAGYKNTAVFKIVDLSFASLFFVCRIVSGTYFLYRICQHPRPSPVLKGVGVAFYAVSWVFFVGIVRYVHRKYVAGEPIGDDSHAS